MPRKLRFLAVFSFFLLFCFVSYLAAAFWPVEQRLALGEFVSLEELFPRFLQNHLVLVTDSGQLGGKNFSLAEKLKLTVPGKFHARVAFHGVIPLKTLVFEVQRVPRVYPGGQAVGLLLHAKGVIVVGYAEVVGRDGMRVSPAAMAGVMVGDVILSANGRAATSDRVLKEVICRAGATGRTVLLEVNRRGKLVRIYVQPRFCQRAGCYRIGLLIRDSTAGVGTLTFYHPETRLYGALGHVVTDATTANPVELAQGSLVEAFIQGVRPGERGRPGEKIGIVSENSALSGTIEQNTEYGIFGHLHYIPVHPLFGGPIPVALAHQVHPGRARMLTVVAGNNLESFEIEILKVNPLSPRGKKDIILRVTDRRLLRYTGGIIQGMSGSPIVQDGRLAGAVTHVFVSSPERGYGIFAERMLRKCGLLTLPETKTQFFSRIGLLVPRAVVKYL